MKDVAHWFWWFTVRDRVVSREFQLLITAAGSSWSPPGVLQEVRGPVGPSSWTGPHIKEVQLFLWTRWSWTASDRKPKDNWKLQRRPDWHIRLYKEETDSSPGSRITSCLSFCLPPAASQPAHLWLVLSSASCRFEPSDQSNLSAASQQLRSTLQSKPASPPDGLDFCKSALESRINPSRGMNGQLNICRHTSHTCRAGS